MKNVIEIKAIAYERLQEAKILAQNGKVDGAFYLAGYCIELTLKAKICEHLCIPNLFDEEDGTKIQGSKFNEIRRAFKIHNLIHLLWLSGLKAKFDKEKAHNRELLEANSLLFENWDEQCRYKPCGFCNSSDVEKLISLIDEPKNGIIQWISRT